MGRRPAAKAPDLCSQHRGSGSGCPLQESKAPSARLLTPPPPWNAQVLHASRADLQGSRGAALPTAGPGTASTASGGPARGLGRRSTSRTRLPAPRGASLPIAGPEWGGCRSPLGWDSRGQGEVMRVGESYVTLGPSSAIAHPQRRCAPPHYPAQMGIQSAEGYEIGSQRPLYLRNSPYPRPRPSRGAESKAPECSRAQEPGWGVECLSSPGQRGGNSSSRESKLPRVWPRAPNGVHDPGQGPGMEGGPERLSRAMAAPGTSGSATAVATPPLQLSRRVAGELRGEGEGSREGKGGERLLVPCACAKRRYAAPRVLLSAGSAPTGRLLGCWPPPCPAAGAKDHQRRAGRSRVPLGRPLAASLSSAATSGARGASQMS